MATEILRSQDLPFPIETVWRALTDAQQASQWQATSDIRPVVGHRFRLIDAPSPPWDGVIKCQVLEVEAPHRLTYSWETAGSGPHRVEWHLKATPKGTTLQVRHTGFAADWPIRAIVDAGYGALLERLTSLLETGTPQRTAYKPTPTQLT